ncbi:MAG: hypothetical protein Q8S03_15540 [Brevundimonas sp.]|uniref:hypothetical protein n=1 Tax=Brevundimonas sp. TaxID=1871086 RepID=UPI0027370D76|nr:hypothetical protein [Brevundimonas sp.]MDP3406100.1 hypothetical protein [Brevundimonas sp.]
MMTIDRVPSWALVLAVVVGLGLIAGAIVSGWSLATLTGVAGLLLAGRSGIALARRSGATDQVQ